jgi:hypothetical protein
MEVFSWENQLWMGDQTLSNIAAYERRRIALAQKRFTSAMLVTGESASISRHTTQLGLSSLGEHSLHWKSDAQTPMVIIDSVSLFMISGTSPFLWPEFQNMSTYMWSGHHIWPTHHNSSLENHNFLHKNQHCHFMAIPWFSETPLTHTCWL